MTDWQILGGDPAPGDPGVIERRCGHLRRAERALRDIDDELRRVVVGTVDADWAGESAEAMRGTLGGLRRDLDPIADSFGRVDRAMSTYARELTELQARSRQALRRATRAAAVHDATDRDRTAALHLLGQQRAQLTASRQAERYHSVRRAIGELADPATAGHHAAEADRLAKETRRREMAVLDNETHVRRLDTTIADARWELGAARSDGRAIHDEWDAVSRRTAYEVEDALARQLLNRSWLQKAGDRILREVDDILRFLQDPLHNLSVLRTWLDRYIGLLDVLSVALYALAGLIALTGIGLPVAAVLLKAAAILSMASFVLTSAKLALDLHLWGNGYTEDGRVVVHDTDIALGVVAVGLGAIGIFQPAAKVSKLAFKKLGPEATEAMLRTQRKAAKDAALTYGGEAGKGTIGLVGPKVAEGPMRRAEDGRSWPRFEAYIPPRCLGATPAGVGGAR